LLVVTTGCTALFGIEEIPYSTGDGGRDTGSGSGDASSCLGPAGWALCLTTPPTNQLVLPTTIDTKPTSSDCLSSPPASWSSAGQPDACMIVAASITISSSVTVTGSRPLVLAATGSITVAGTLDVASYSLGAIGQKQGPAANSASCDAFLSAPIVGGPYGGGGAGGSFGTLGGRGGFGNGDPANAGSPPPAITSNPTTLRGGCRGQDGGLGQSPIAMGANSGGAVYVVAGTSISFMPSSSINASGAGAYGGGQRSGGGGGGTGGMIALHAPSITVASGGATLFANGGGASSGGGSNQSGIAGADPSMPTIPARGGTDAMMQNFGGDGFAGGIPATDGIGKLNFGGGGGGGGGGYIMTSSPLQGATVSPVAAGW
jgi:hypothetical protein